MKALVRLYPRSWRERYGPELELLLDQLPSNAGVAIDVLVGAAVAYRDVIRSNRVLSAAGAYLHGVCVAVLLQAIAFVSLILYAQGSEDQTDVNVGPVHLATVALNEGRLLYESLVVLKRWSEGEWIIALVLISLLVAALAALMATPRMLRALR